MTGRLFFALWPAAETRAALVSATAEQVRLAGGRAVPAHQLHLTLAYLGAQPPERLAKIVTAARTIRCDRTRLTLDRFGFWPRPRVLWLGPSRQPAQVGRLVGALWLALAPLGIERERRKFKAHVTLVRKVPVRPEFSAAGPVEWPIDEFALVESVTAADGVQYSLVERFTTGSPADP